MKNDRLKDSNSKAILQIKQIMAPILKAVLEEFNDVDVTEIAEIYLSDPLDKDNPKIKLLNTENGGFEKLTTRMDLLFKVSTPYDYDLIVNFEIFTTQNNSAIQVRLRIYQSNQFVNQSYKLVELENKDSENNSSTIYNNLDHPVQISLFTHPSNKLKNTITRIENNPKKFIFSDGLNGKVVKKEEVNLLSSERNAYALDRSITINLDFENESEPNSLFDYLKNGLFRKDTNNLERLNTIKKYTGNLTKENEMKIEAMIGSNEWYEQIGREHEREKNRQTILNVLRSRGFSEEDAQKEVDLLLPE